MLRCRYVRSKNNMQLKITLLNADKLKSVFMQAPGIAHAEYLNALESTARFVESKAKHAAPVGNYKGGGSLRQSIKTTPYSSTGFIVRVNSLYGVYVDQGTKPHVIVPKYKKMLAFKVNGQWVRAKRVNHPGTKAQPFFSNAVDAAGPYANKEMGDAMTRVLNKIKVK